MGRLGLVVGNGLKSRGPRGLFWYTGYAFWSKPGMLEYVLLGAKVGYGVLGSCKLGEV